MISVGKERKPVPEFQSLEEMAEFWDTHDSTEVEVGNIESVRYEPKKIVLSVRFDAGDMVNLQRMARKLGMDRSTFVRFVVKQYLNRHYENGQQITEPPSKYGHNHNNQTKE